VDLPNLSLPRHRVALGQRSWTGVLNHPDSTFRDHSGQAITEAIAAVRRLTERPFAVNLFIPQPYRIEAHKIERSQVWR
jgi:LmbE family N-acetylglucosaminyl deacetylase